MDKNYQNLKASGLVTIINTGTSYAISYKQFSTEDGTALPDRVVIVNDQAILQQNIDLQTQIDANNIFLSELQSTPITPPIVTKPPIKV